MARFPIAIFVVTALLHGIAGAVDYELRAPYPPIYTDHTTAFQIKSAEPIEIGDLPPHPNITWISAYPGTLYTAEKERFHYTSVRFVAHSSGKVELPPVPAVIGGVSLLLTVPAFDVIPNPLPPDEARLIVLWNGDRKPPASVRVGQTIDVEILQLVPLKADETPYFARPDLNFDGVRWDRFGNDPARTIRYSYFFPLGPRYYSTTTTTYRGREHEVRRYKVRFTVPHTGKVTGSINATFGYARDRRTSIVSFSARAKPLPEPPAASCTNTGLVGDWTFSATLEPPQPEAGRPFTLHLDIEGTGEPTRLEELDFSRTGFPSLNTTLETKDEATFDRWRARFTQTFLPSGETPVFPAITLASFDQATDSWILHPVTQRSVLEGHTLPSAQLAPATAFGPAVRRPVLLNLPLYTFLAFGLCPLLPLAAGLLLHLYHRRDPERTARRRKLRSLTSLLRTSDAETAATLISHEALPLLRRHLELSGGASTLEVATALETSDSELAELLRQQAAADFSGTKGPNPVQVADHLARLAFILIVLLLPLSLGAATLEEANTAYTDGHYDSAIQHYQELLDTHPDHPALHLNLAKAFLAADRVAEARAVCYTALLLQPRDREAHALMDRILVELGHPALPGSAVLDLRPDQLMVLASIIWGLGFVLLAARRFVSLPLWAPLVPIVLAPLLLGAAFWRNANAYAPDQFMVLADELPREIAAGTPSFEYPPLGDGDIIRSAGRNSSQSHVLVETATTSFWLPANQLRQVW